MIPMVRATGWGSARPRPPRPAPHTGCRRCWASGSPRLGGARAAGGGLGGAQPPSECHPAARPPRPARPAATAGRPGRRGRAPAGLAPGGWRESEPGRGHPVPGQPAPPRPRASRPAVAYPARRHRAVIAGSRLAAPAARGEQVDWRSVMLAAEQQPVDIALGELNGGTAAPRPGTAAPRPGMAAGTAAPRPGMAAPWLGRG